MRKYLFDINKLPLKLISIIAVVLCILLIFFKIFPNPLPFNRVSYLEKSMNSILEINNSSKEFLDSSSLNVKKALEVLPKMKGDLMNISIEINSTDRKKTPDIEENLTLLSKGLSENILVIEQLEAMLQNPNGNDINLAADNLKVYRDTADSYYGLLSLNEDNYNLGTPLYTTINAALDYCISINNEKKIAELKTIENNNFFNSINDLIISMDNLIINYYDNVADCRNSKKTYELLIAEINTNSSKLQSVKDVLSKLSVPDDFHSIYNDFSEIVNLYSDYLYNFKYNVATEKVLRKNEGTSEETINSLYESSNKALTEIEKKYKKFTKAYNNLNRNY